LFDRFFCRYTVSAKFSPSKLKDVSSKRVQSQTCLSFAEQEKRLMRMKSKLLPLVVRQTFFLYASAVKILNASTLRFRKTLSN